MLEFTAARFRRLARNDFLRYAAITFGAQSSVNLLGFVFHMIVTRRLGVAGYGSLSALLNGFSVLIVPATILATVVARYAAEFRALDDAGRLRMLVVRVGSLLGGGAVFTLIVGTLLSSLVARYLHLDDLLSVVLTAAILAVNLVLVVLRGILQGIEDFWALGLSLLSEGVAKVIVLLAVVQAAWGVDGALAAWLSGSTLSLAWTVATLARRFHPFAASPLHVDFGKLLRTTGCVALAMLCVASLTFSDVVVVKHVFDARQAGLYSAASLAGKILFWLVAFVPIVILPRATHHAMTGRPVRSILVQALLMVTLPATATLLVFATAPVLIVRTLTGPAFLAAAPLLLPYGVAMTLLAATNTVVLFKIGIHRFAFVAPLIVVALLELIAIATFHRTPLQVIQILIFADAVALIVTLVEIRLPRFAAMPGVGPQEARAP